MLNKRGLQPVSKPVEQSLLGFKTAEKRKKIQGRFHKIMAQGANHRDPFAPYFYAQLFEKLFTAAKVGHEGVGRKNSL